MKPKRSVLSIFLLLSLPAVTNGFLPNASRPRRGLEGKTLRMSDDNQQEKLAKLGFSEDEIARSKKQSSEDNEINVNVNIVDDIDPVTLTAVAFGLIAFNFLVLANLGDGGIAGLVATVINTMRQ